MVCVTDSSPVESAALAAHAADAAPTPSSSPRRFTFRSRRPSCTRTSSSCAADVACRWSRTTSRRSPRSPSSRTTVRRLLDNPKIVGLKDTSGDIDYFQEVRRITRERERLAALHGPRATAGGVGQNWAATAACAAAPTCCPSCSLIFYEAAVAGDADRLAPLMKQVRPRSARSTNAAKAPQPRRFAGSKPRWPHWASATA